MYGPRVEDKGKKVKTIIVDTDFLMFISLASLVNTGVFAAYWIG